MVAACNKGVHKHGKYRSPALRLEEHLLSVNLSFERKQSFVLSDAGKF